MMMKIQLSGMAIVGSMLLIFASGCASSSVEPSSSKPQSSVVSIEQPPMSNYMRSQIGTPNELSPIAPAQARNIRKVGNHWRCDLNGKEMIYNEASACWEPQH